MGPRLALTLVCLAAAAVPGAIAVSQHRLEAAQGALARGDCRTAEKEASGALDVIGFRAEPREILAYCAARRGDLRSALSEARQAVRRDPKNWLYRYDVALMTAASGGDARGPAQVVAALNPLEPFAFSAPRVLVGTGAKARARQLIRASR